MTKKTISEDGMPNSMRKFMNAVRPNVEFGRKPAPEPETEDEAGARRTSEVTARAKAEKSYGVMRDAANKSFGKKAPVADAEPAAETPERTADDRRQSVVDRAKSAPAGKSPPRPAAKPHDDSDEELGRSFFRGDRFV